MIRFLFQAKGSSNKIDQLLECKQWIHMDDETKPNASIQRSRLCIAQASKCKAMLIPQSLWNVIKEKTGM